MNAQGFCFKKNFACSDFFRQDFVLTSCPYVYEDAISLVECWLTNFAVVCSCRLKLNYLQSILMLCNFRCIFLSFFRTGSRNGDTGGDKSPQTLGYLCHALAYYHHFKAKLKTDQANLRIHRGPFLATTRPWTLVGFNRHLSTISKGKLKWEIFPKG